MTRNHGRRTRYRDWKPNRVKRGDTYNVGVATRAVPVICTNPVVAVPLTVIILLSEYAGMTALGPLVAWSYPTLQPVSRSLMAAWLWQTAARSPAAA